MIFLALPIVAVLGMLAYLHTGAADQQGTPLTNPKAVESVRYPQWVIAEDNLFLVWVERQNGADYDQFDCTVEHTQHFLRYGIVAAAGQVLATPIAGHELPIVRYLTAQPYPDYHMVFS